MREKFFNGLAIISAIFVVYVLCAGLNEMMKDQALKLCRPVDKLIVKEVRAIGGCDRYGVCGVLYTDGTAGEVKFPVAGMKVPITCVRP